MNQCPGQSPGGSTKTCNTSNVVGTITHKVCNTSTLRFSLYEFGEQVCTQSPLFCLGLGLGFYYWEAPPVSNLFFSVVSLSLRQVLVEPYRDHRLRVSVFRCCVSNFYLAIVTETFLYALPRNRCLRQPRRRVSTSRYLAMDLHVIIYTARKRGTRFLYSTSNCVIIMALSSHN
jgi:hypothetical protein